uniref:Uncharacterized protein n=1 Tax=viral metagenome TaxID=1070528 RepID=A0A6C0AU22_9ZZZZ
MAELGIVYNACDAAQPDSVRVLTRHGVTEHRAHHIYGVHEAPPANAWRCFLVYTDAVKGGTGVRAVAEQDVYAGRARLHSAIACGTLPRRTLKLARQLVQTLVSQHGISCKYSATITGEAQDDSSSVSSDFSSDSSDSSSDSSDSSSDSSDSTLDEVAADDGQGLGLVTVQNEAVLAPAVHDRDNDSPPIVALQDAATVSGDSADGASVCSSDVQVQRAALSGAGSAGPAVPSGFAERCMQSLALHTFDGRRDGLVHTLLCCTRCGISGNSVLRETETWQYVWSAFQRMSLAMMGSNDDMVRSVCAMTDPVCAAYRAVFPELYELNTTTIPWPARVVHDGVRQRLSAVSMPLSPDAAHDALSEVLSMRAPGACPLALANDARFIIMCCAF